jgi:hypothetical protein
MNKIYLITLFLGVTLAGNAQFWKVTEPQKLAGTINVLESEESIPIFSKDSSTLYFVRTFDGENKGGLYDQDIWFSQHQDDGTYTNAKPVKDVNNKLNNAIVGLSKDGTSMYLLNSYEGKKDTVKGIAVSRQSGSGWSKPEALDIPGLSIGGKFYGFHMSDAGDALIISYAGQKSVGEEDLYVSLNTDGKWSAPIHLGNTINSTGFEISPFLSSNQDTLFFSSNGFGGEGDADIFYSVRNGSWNSWSAPKNLGSSINSPKFDAYFTLYGKDAYWSSNREGERSDIYSSVVLTPPPLFASAVGTDVTVYRGADGRIDCTPSGGVAPFTYAWSNGSSKEDPTGLVQGEYTVWITDDVGQITEVTVMINEPPLEIEPVVVVDVVNTDFQHFFGYNRNKLKISGGDLRRFVREIEDQVEKGRERVTIKVFSSASNVPTKSFSSNDELAKLRAENMKYDLVSHFEKNKKLKGKVTVVIVSTQVQGPQYESDAGNRKKYEPFQYVQMVTE